MSKKQYLVTLAITSDSDPRDWHLGETLVIDEEYTLVSVHELKQETKGSNK
jgi:hypothetical protein